jgi:hypothetical protein
MTTPKNQQQQQAERAAEEAARNDPTTEAHQLTVRSAPQTLRVDPRPRAVPTADDFNAPNPPVSPHGSRDHLHVEQQGWLVDLIAASNADPGNVEKLAAVVREIVRMIRHDDIPSSSKGLPR